MRELKKRLSRLERKTYSQASRIIFADRTDSETEEEFRKTLERVPPNSIVFVNEARILD
ncbi:Uncharacterised protein [Streptococcus suis]|nr:Uncharacterised protein [Streptococcus suis]CYU66105.1 Uncharacterised protein [Streptococcus suis]